MQQQDARKKNQSQAAKKTYVAPSLRKQGKLVDITAGAPLGALTGGGFGEPDSPNNFNPS